MSTFMCLMLAESIKVRRSAAFRLIWSLPVLFLVVGHFVFGPARNEPPAEALATAPLRAVGTLWAGFFHPLLLALLPAMVFRPEHRFGLWKHLQALPVRPSTLFFCKAIVTLLLSAATLGLVVVGMWVEHAFFGPINPKFPLPFPWWSLLSVMGWLFLGSLPLIGLYVWVSDRISSGAISIVFGVIGLMLTIALSGQELDPSWRRDLIPWVLPYSCAQQAIENPEARQSTHLAATPFGKQIDLNPLTQTEVYYLPSGRKVTSKVNIPNYYLLPPPPTPRWLLVTFSLGVGTALLAAGMMDAGRNRP